MYGKATRHGLPVVTRVKIYKTTEMKSKQRHNDRIYGANAGDLCILLVQYSLAVSSVHPFFHSTIP
jgi:hypothetical protein